MLCEFQQWLTMLMLNIKCSVCLLICVHNVCAVSISHTFKSPWCTISLYFITTSNVSTNFGLSFLPETCQYSVNVAHFRNLRVSASHAEHRGSQMIDCRRLLEAEQSSISSVVSICPVCSSSSPKFSVTHLNWLRKADGWGRPLVALWVATSEVMFSQAAGRKMEPSGVVSQRRHFLPPCGWNYHRLRVSSHTRYCFNDLKDNVPPSVHI